MAKKEKETKIIEKSTYGVPFVLVSVALVALLGLTTKGYTDWTFGLKPSEESSITSSDNLSSSNSEEDPGTSSEELPSNEDPVTSEDSGTSEDLTTSSEEPEVDSDILASFTWAEAKAAFNEIEAVYFNTSTNELSFSFKTGYSVVLSSSPTDYYTCYILNSNFDGSTTAHYSVYWNGELLTNKIDEQSNFAYGCLGTLETTINEDTMDGFDFNYTSFELKDDDIFTIKVNENYITETTSSSEQTIEELLVTDGVTWSAPR